MEKGVAGLSVMLEFCCRYGGSVKIIDDLVRSLLNGQDVYSETSVAGMVEIKDSRQHFDRILQRCQMHAKHSFAENVCHTSEPHCRDRSSGSVQKNTTASTEAQCAASTNTAGTLTHPCHSWSQAWRMTPPYPLSRCTCTCICVCTSTWRQRTFHQVVHVPSLALSKICRGVGLRASGCYSVSPVYDL
jgi:hypothetical protein